MANQVYLSIKYQGINPNSRPESLIQYKQEDVEEEGANIQEKVDYRTGDVRKCTEMEAEDVETQDSVEEIVL